MSDLREALEKLCEDHEAEAVDGGFTDIDKVWPSQIREVLDAYPAEVSVDEWRITGDPGRGYPYYTFVFRSDDPRWPGGQTETKARAQHAAMAKGATWQDGPHLQHRTVTYSPWGEREQVMEVTS